MEIKVKKKKRTKATFNTKISKIILNILKFSILVPRYNMNEIQVINSLIK